jgi:tetratricopeptide (TPR) repeat protein
MKQLALKDLIEQLNENTSQLEENIQALRNEEHLATEIKGFIQLYDLCDGDFLKMRAQIASNKTHILSLLKKESKQSKTFSKFIRYAAIFIVLISCSILSFLYFKTEKLELTAIYKDPGIPTYMSSSSENKLETVMFYFRRNELNNALTLIQPLCKQNPNNDTIVYYTALINHLNQEEKAAAKLFEGLSSKENAFTAKSTYFLAMCYLNQGKHEKALTELEKVIKLNDESVHAFALKNKQEIKTYLANKKH